MRRAVICLFAVGMGLALFSTAPTAPAAPRAKCKPPSQCCQVCVEGKACGNACIAKDKTCHKGRGCACDASEVCAEDP